MHPGCRQGTGAADHGASRYLRDAPGARPRDQPDRRARTRVRRVTSDLLSTDLMSSELETGVDTGNGSAQGTGHQSGHESDSRLGGARLTVLAGPTAVGKGTVA